LKITNLLAKLIIIMRLNNNLLFKKMINLIKFIIIKEIKEKHNFKNKVYKLIR
jgi:hypothetical protein